jgi:ferredoxin
VEHGEGERWYLNARNYAYDLESDLRRRAYVIDFIEGFGEMRDTALAWADRLERLPAPLSRIGREAVSRRMQRNHFGQPVPIEECERIFALATSITAIPCICRMHTPGKRAEEVCLLVTTRPAEAVVAEGFASYAHGPTRDDFNRIGVDEAMALLRTCEEQGLMHSVWTFQTPFTAAICNCDLESGCMAMRMTAGHDIRLMWRGEWVARLERERCVECGACVRICPFDAIDAGPLVTLRERDCWGCGVCRSACRTGALTLVDRREVPAVAALW